MLYIVATPIGNRSDITFRAIETLKQCAYILCEDTRHSRPFLAHYEIRTPLKSYHKFSEARHLEEILADLRNGVEIALISDAGTPTISDPGERLVAACREHSIAVTSIPGPCAAIAALSLSGLPSERFQFIGFLPKRPSQMKAILKELLCYPHSTICYESPQRVITFLTTLHNLAPEAKLVIARELTKKFETIYSGTAGELLSQLAEVAMKGEIVIIIHPPASEPTSLDLIETEFAALMSEGELSTSAAIKQLSLQHGLPKNQIYNLLHKNNQKQ